MALYGHDADKSRILGQLRRALSLVGGDRGAIVWLDEYGPGMPHVYALLDLAADRPRRGFSATPFTGAWEVGVPGLLDLPDVQARSGDAGPGIRSLCAVALGSDGPRSWFLCVDSLTPRPSLSPRVAGDLMFVAGECASVLLHRDLEKSAANPASGSSGAAGEGDRFAGWPVLKDIEGLEGDEEANRRISGRFLVARLLRGLLDDDLVADPASLEHQLKGVRREISSRDGAGLEGEVWDRALAAVEGRDFRGLLSATLEWGSLVESMGHLSGAREIHSMAYELAVAEGELGSAVDAARFRARVSRKLARWEDAVHWYGVARSVAEEAGEKRKLAMVMDGLGNAYRDRGNLPRAREILGQVLALGRREGDRHAEAVAHHDLMTVEKLSGNLEEAVAHGWAASQRYEDREGRLKALFDLAGVLKESGELSAAWDAYSVVAAQIGSHEYRLMSVDGLAHVAALRGQEGRYEALRSRVDQMAWREASPVIQAQVLLYRGLSLQALWRLAEAKDWLERALAYAEKHGLSQRIFEAERALGDLESVPRRTAAGGTSPGLEVGEEVLQVRAGLREMREALAGAGGSL